MSRTAGWVWRTVVLAAVFAAVASSPARATGITEFKSGLPAGANPTAPTAGPDGNVWFADLHGIGRVTPSGAINEFTNGLGAGNNLFGDLVVGNDKNLWFSDDGTTKALGRITPAGVITEFKAGLNPGAVPENLTVGSDGNVWFLDLGTPKAIGRVTPAGVITEFSTGLNPNSQPNDLTVGGDGSVWFTDQGDTKAIGRVKPDGTINEFFTGLIDPMHSFPNDITAGADGNVYFSDDGTPASVGRVKPDGTIDEFTAGLGAGGTAPDALTAAPDGNVWFADQYSTHRAIGRIKPDGTITEFDQGLSTDVPGEPVLGADGNLWLEQSSNIGVARVTLAGTITEFKAGLDPLDMGAESDGMTAGPDGNLWFTDGGSTGPPVVPKAIGKLSLQLAPTASTGTASGVGNTTATLAGSVNPLGAATQTAFEYGTSAKLGSKVGGTALIASGDAKPVSGKLAKLPSGTVIYYRVKAVNAFGTVLGAVRTFKTTGKKVAPKPKPKPKAKVTKATFGNQRITLTTPASSVCTPRAKSLAAALASVKIPKSKGTKLRFSSGAFYLDKGVKHRHKKTWRTKSGKKKTVFVTVYAANAVAHHVPVKPHLRLKGLGSRTHSLKVVLAYKKTVVRQHKKKSVTVRKTVTVKFRVC
jgi:streptogramin lyase